jgi:hypothetical protein
MNLKQVGGTFLGLLTLSLTVMPLAHADEVVDCDTVAECRAQMAVIEERIRVLEGASGARRTSSGHAFTHDSSVAALGDAWRDESGMIWGDIVRNSDGSIRYMDQYDAVSYCQGIGAELPTLEDFARLRSYMGASVGSPSGYTLQVLPNLYRTEGGSPVSNYFWSSSFEPFYSKVAYYFDGLNGVNYIATRSYVYDGIAVLCVARR